MLTPCKQALNLSTAGTKRRGVAYIKIESNPLTKEAIMAMKIRTYALLQFLNPIAKKPMQQLHRQCCRIKGRLYFSSTSIPLMKAKVWIETAHGAKFPIAYSSEDGAFLMDMLTGRGPSTLRVSYFGKDYTFENISSSLGSVFHPGFMTTDDLSLVLDVEKSTVPFIRLTDEKN
jgi:hypothetical protein